MSKKPASSSVIRKSSKNIRPASKADLKRMRGAMEGDIDTSDIAEKQNFERLKRDASGALPRRKSIIRDAVEAQRKRSGLSVYRLWQKARVYHPSLSQAAVHEFLKGQRQLELPSAEALLAAVDLQVVRAATGNKAKAKRPTKARIKQ